MTEDVKRDGHASRRIATEARLVGVAAELFVARGYAATTLADVAAEAGVSPRTVYVRFATKADLLLRCIGIAIAGDDTAAPIAERSWMTDAMRAPTLAERLAKMATVTADLMQRSGALLGVAQQAAASEPSVAAAEQAGRDDTRRTLATFWRGLRDDNLIPKAADLEWLTETGTLLAHAETYLLLRATTDWDIARYRAWLEQSWHRLVIASSTGLARGSRRRAADRA